MDKNKKIVLITGGTSGIGKSTAIKLSEKGYIVFTTTRDLNSNRAVEFRKTIEESNLDIKLLELDLEKKQTIELAVRQVLSNTGKIDILINNAATGYFSAVEDIDTDYFLKTININLAGTINLIKNVLPSMRNQKSGLIINISSILGFSTVPLNSPYSISKYAIESLSETLAIEVAPYNIDVVIMQPGDFHSNFIKNAKRAEFNDKSPYYKLYKRSEDKLKEDPSGKNPDIFAEAIVKVCESKNPKLRYMVGKEVAIKKFLHLILIDKLWIRFLRFFYKW